MTWKVFWYQCGRGHGNFGDVLTPLLLDYFNVRCEWAPPEKADLAGIGSICEKITADFRGVIWSSGNLRESHRNHFPAARVVALRGKLTREHTTCAASGEMALGDGGLLCNLLAPQVRKRYKLGIIPHYVDQDHEALLHLAKSSPDICLIDICDPPRAVIRNAAQCEAILSSSLHGLVLADSLGIPNRWLQAYGDVLGAGFKFRDYYSVYEIDCPEPLVIRASDNLDTLLPHIGSYQRPGIEQIQAKLLNCLEDVLGSLPRVRTTAAESLQHKAVKLEKEPNGAGSNDRAPFAVVANPTIDVPRRRLFVVGTGRSGTCWLGDILGTHPEIRSFLEPRPVFDLVTTLAIDSRCEIALLNKIYQEYDRLFALAFPSHFADKTHPLLWIAEKVASHYADSLFVAIQRDVEPTVASMLQHAGVRRWCEEWNRYPVPNRFLGITAPNLNWYRHASTLQRCVARWWAHRNEVLRLAPILGDRMLVLQYESLVTDARAGMVRIREFLGLRQSFPIVEAQFNSLHKWKSYLSHDDVLSIHDTLNLLSATN